MTISYRDSLLATVEQLPEQDVQTLLDFARFLLRRPHLYETGEKTSSHGHIELVPTRSGFRAMIRGTRVPVAAIVGYTHLGETPETIANDVLPFLTLAQIHDALSYYYDHQAEIDHELDENTESASRARLRERLGDEDFYKLTGESE